MSNREKTVVISIFIALGCYAGYIASDHAKKVPAETKAAAGAPKIKPAAVPAPSKKPGLMVAASQPAAPQIRPGLPTQTVQDYFASFRSGGEGGKTNAERLLNLSRNYGDIPTYLMDMYRSVVNFRNLRVLNEKQEGQKWKVSIAIEATSIESAFASALIHEVMRQGAEDVSHVPMTNADTFLSPKKNGIETFTAFRTSIPVVCDAKGACYVDLCHDNKTCQKYENIANYALESGSILRGVGFDPEATALDRQMGPEAMKERLIAWLSREVENLNFAASQAETIVRAGQDIFMKTPIGQLRAIQAPLEQQ